MKREIHPVTCPFCSLLCNDLQLTFDGDCLADFSPACSLGETGFRLAVAESAFEEPVHSGFETSLRAAMTWLNEARQPLVVLSGNLDNEAISTAVQLAKQYSAILTCDEDCSGSVLGLSVQTTGLLTDTLRDLRGQSLVVLCGVNHAQSHPRLGEMLGRDLESDSLPFNPSEPLEAIRWLRVANDNTTEPIPARFAAITARIKAADSGVVVFGLEWLKTGRPFTTELLLWLKGLNRVKHWYGLYLAPDPNTTGLIETGFPGNLRFGQGKTEFSPRMWRAESIILQGGSDLYILVGQPVSFSEKTLRLLSQGRTILLDSEMPAWNPPIWLPTSRIGVGCPGRFLRLDGVPVELQPVLPSRQLLMKDLLLKLAHEEHPL